MLEPSLQQLTVLWFIDLVDPLILAVF